MATSATACSNCAGLRPARHSPQRNQWIQWRRSYARLDGAQPRHHTTTFGEIFRATFGAVETSNQLGPELVHPPWGRLLMLAGMRSCFPLSFLLVFSVAGYLPVQAQIHGVPASVTSFGFGGSGNSTPRVPDSVTSLGPNGYGDSLPAFRNF